MDVKRMTEIAAQRGSSVNSSDSSVRKYDYVLNLCRKYISERSELFRNLEPAERVAKIHELIMAFNLQNKFIVDDCRNEDGSSDTTKLLERLTDSIQNYGKLTEAMEDDRVYEIRGNGKFIKVEKAGRCQDLRDQEGNLICFDTPEEQEVIMRKMLGDVVFNPSNALVNATTVEGYRLAATHSSVCGVDPNEPPGTGQYHTFVLRKFKKAKMGLPDIARGHTISDNMARLFALFMRGGIAFFTCGPTASGKSTTNNAIIQEVPVDKRLVLLQNVSEIDGRIRDATGRVINDVVHLEYRDIPNAGPHDPTQANMTDQILRFSPNFIVFGEWRSDIEFKKGMQLGEAGHPLNTTLHAEDSLGAIKRVQTAYLAESGNQPADLALANICGVVNFIIIQHILADNSRRVLRVTEVCGVDEHNPNMPKLNDIFVYKFNGKPKYNPDGTVKEIPGYHQRVGKISARTIEKFKRAGITESQYDFLLKDPSTNEKETYTGENIHNYGISKEDLA